MQHTIADQLLHLPLFDRSKWQRVRFGDVVKQMKEQVDPAADGIERYVAGEHMETENVHIRKWGTVGDGYLGPAFIRGFRKGQVLYGSRRTYLKKVAVAEWDGVTANTTFVLETVEGKLLQKLLPWLMLSERFTKHSVQESKGSTNPYINFPDIAKFEFDLPPLDQQRRIAEILWAVDEAEQSFAVLVENVGLTRTAKFDGLIPFPGNSDRSVRFVRLDEVASMQNGRPFPSSEYQEAATPGVRLIRPGNLAPDGRIGWARKSTVTLPEKHRTENEGWFIGAGQVLINLTAQSLDDGFMGRVCFTGEDDGGMLNQRIGRFVLDDSILPKFFFRCLQTSRFRQLVENRCEGSKVRHLYFRHFEDFMLPAFPKPKQAEIADELDACEAALTSAIKQRDALLGLRGTLINTILQ